MTFISFVGFTDCIHATGSNDGPDVYSSLSETLEYLARFVGVDGVVLEMSLAGILILPRLVKASDLEDLLL